MEVFESIKLQARTVLPSYICVYVRPTFRPYPIHLAPLIFAFPLFLSYPTVFLDMCQDGLIVSAKAKESLRAWRSISKLVGADVTHGAAQTIAHALRVVEIKGEEGREAGREGVGQQDLARLQSLGEELQQSEAFRGEDDGVRALYVTTYEPKEGLVIEASNAAFDDLFSGASELMACQISRQTASPLLFAA